MSLPVGGAGSVFRHSESGESRLSRQSLLKVYQLRDRVSDAERFYIDTIYDRDVTGNLERERQTLGSCRGRGRIRAIRFHSHCWPGTPTRSIGEYALAIEQAGQSDGG